MLGQKHSLFGKSSREDEPLRPYERTCAASAHNPFVKALYSSRTCWLQFLEKKKRAGVISPAVLLHDLQVTVGYTAEAMALARRNAQLIHTDSEDRFIPLMWKHWIAHRAWFMGFFALIIKEIEGMKSSWEPTNGEAETDESRGIRGQLAALSEQVRQNHEQILSLQFYCTNQEWNEQEKSAYDTCINQLRHVVGICERNIGPDSVIDNMAAQLRDALTKLFSYKNPQINPPKDIFKRAYKVLQARQYAGEGIEEIVERMQQLDYLDPHSKVNVSLDQSVEESINMCQEYEEMGVIRRARAAVEEAAASLVSTRKRMRLFKYSSKNLMECLLTASKAIAWPVIAPILGIKDAFCDTNSFAEYNAGIKKVFMKNPWTVTIMTLGLLGAIAANIYLLLPAAVGALAIMHGAIMGALLIGGGGWFTAGYLLERQQEQLLKEKEDRDERMIAVALQMQEEMQLVAQERCAQFKNYSDKRHHSEKTLADKLAAVYNEHPVESFFDDHAAEAEPRCAAGLMLPHQRSLQFAITPNPQEYLSFEDVDQLMHELNEMNTLLELAETQRAARMATAEEAASRRVDLIREKFAALELD